MTSTNRGDQMMVTKNPATGAYLLTKNTGRWVTFSTDERRLARAFHEAIRAELSEHLEEIDRRNASEDYEDGCCATHDFCDANIVMLGAFYCTFGREPDMLDSIDMAMWDKAWDVAVEVGFSRDFV